MTALTREPVGVMRETPPDAGACTAPSSRRSRPSARASGVDLPADTVERIMTCRGGSLPPEPSLAGPRPRCREDDSSWRHCTDTPCGWASATGCPRPAVFAVYAALMPHVAGRRG